MLHSTLKKTLLILSLLLIRTEAVADNSVNITQVGDTNIINMDIQGDDNTVVAKQACSANTCNGDTMVMDVTGDRNTMNLGQGYKISERVTGHMTIRNTAVMIWTCMLVVMITVLNCHTVTII